MRLERTNSENSDFVKLVGLLDAGLRIIDGDEAPFFAQYNKIDSIKHVVIAYVNDEAVGCGAFKMHESGAGEIKRMFVVENERGKGIAAAVLTELENWAREEGFKKAILETGDKMTSAIALYKKSGYIKIPNYGQYIGVASSVCMEKTLTE